MKKYEFMKDTDENGKESINVSYKPKRRLDLFARLVCFAIAAVIWLWIVNFNQTDVTETMVLKIEYAGLENLEQEGKMIYGVDKTEVTVTVRGSNRDIKKHDPEDYSVVVDVSEIDDAGSYTLPLTVKIPSDSNVTVDADSSHNISLICDYNAEKYIGFDVLVSNFQDGGPISYSYESLQSEIDILIKGPKRVIDMINSARFNANGNFVSSFDEMEYSDFPLVFLDKNLNEVNDDGTVEYSTEDITVNVFAVAHKSIPVEIRINGTGAELVKNVSADSVEIWGAPSVVREIKSYPIVITNAVAGMIKQHELTNEKLAEGVSVKESVIITISFEELLGDNE